MHGHVNVKIEGYGLKFSLGYLLVLDLQMSFFQKLFIISVAHKIDYRLNMNINLNETRYGQLAIVLKHCLNKYNCCFTGFYIRSASNFCTQLSGSLPSILCVLNL